MCHFHETPSSRRDHTVFEALVRVQINTVDQAKEWVKASFKSGVTWRVQFTKPPKGKRLLYKITMLFCND